MCFSMCCREPEANTQNDPSATQNMADTSPKPSAVSGRPRYATVRPTPQDEGQPMVRCPTVKFLLLNS